MSLLDDVRSAIDAYELATDMKAHALRALERELSFELVHRTQTITCSCGCGATKPDDGLCECGAPKGHS